MSLEQTETQDFEQGFAAAANPEYEPPTAPPDDSGDADVAPDSGVSADAGNDGNINEGESADAARDAEIVLDGMTRAEVRNLLSRVSEMDGLKDGLRKAYGKIGELNGRLKESPAHAATFGALQGMSFADMDGDDFDATVSKVMAQAKIDNSVFGDFSEEGMTRGIVATMLRLQQMQPTHTARPLHADPQESASAPAIDQEHQKQEAVAHDSGQQQSAPSADTNLLVEQMVLDRVRPGWRDTVLGQDFGLWVGTQSPAAQEEIRQAVTADGFISVLDRFGQWDTARQAVSTQRTKAQQRLEGAITPSGNAPKPQSAMSEREQFEAAFNALMKQR